LIAALLCDVEPLEEEAMQKVANEGFRLNIWALTIGFTVAAMVDGLLAWPAHVWMHPRFGMGTSPGMFGGPGAVGVPGMMGQQGMVAMHGSWNAGWVLVCLLALGVYAGVAGAIIGAVYNAVVSRRQG
jgi:hypothetical protein